MNVMQAAHCRHGLISTSGGIWDLYKGDFGITLPVSQYWSLTCLSSCRFYVLVMCMVVESTW